MGAPTPVSANNMRTANVARNEGRIQVVACCKLDTAYLHSRRTEDCGGKSGWAGVGSVSCTVRCSITRILIYNYHDHLENC